MKKNNNLALAEVLDTITLELCTLDLSSAEIGLPIAKKTLKHIDHIAKEMEIPSLRALTHWMLLNTEEDANNSENTSTDIKELCASGSYFNWIEILSALLQTEDQSLVQELQQSLTSPNWPIKPSSILQKELFEWIEATTSINANDPSSMSNKETESLREDVASDVPSIDIASIDELVTPNSNNLEEQKNRESYYKKLNKKQATSDNSTLTKTNKTENKNCFAKLHLELEETINSLFTLSNSSEDVLKDADIFNNKLEQLIVFANSCSYTIIAQTCRWTYSHARTQYYTPILLKQANAGLGWN